MNDKYIVRDFTEADAPTVWRMLMDTHRAAGESLTDEQTQMMLIAAPAKWRPASPTCAATT